MFLASAPRTQLQDTSAADNHRDHRCTAGTAFCAPDQFGVTVRTEHMHNGIQRYLVFGMNNVAPPQTRYREPPVCIPK